MANKDLEARAESRGTSQERKRKAAREGVKAALAARRIFRVLVNILSLVFLFVGMWVLRRQFITKVKEFYNQILVPSLASFILFILFLFLKEIQLFMCYFSIGINLGMVIV